jgi:hypothetical protein
MDVLQTATTWGYGAGRDATGAYVAGIVGRSFPGPRAVLQVSERNRRSQKGRRSPETQPATSKSSPTTGRFGPLSMSRGGQPPLSWGELVNWPVRRWRCGENATGGTRHRTLIGDQSSGQEQGEVDVGSNRTWE